MARCSYHPDVETELTCTTCGKPICPIEMVLTPVGYKCPEDARLKKSQYQFVKPKQFAAALAAGIGVGIVGALILAAVSFGGFWLGIIWGAVTAEAVRRASGGHRGYEVGVAAAIGIGVGWLVGSLFGGVWFVTAIVAAVVALVQLSAFPKR